MERVLIVNADDFGLSKGQNYGIIEACRNGVVTSTTALVNGAAIDHAAQLSRSTPELRYYFPGPDPILCIQTAFLPNQK